MLRFFIVILFLAVPACAQKMRDDMTPLGLSYELKVLEDTQTLAVSMTIVNAKRDRTYIAMPNWTPGSYRPQRFGEWVSNVKGKDTKTGQEVTVEKIDPLTWSVDTSKHRDVKITYEIEPRRWRFTGGEPKVGRVMTGMHYEGPATFMYIRGHERGTPVSCRYVLPKNWQVANGMLFDDDPFFRHAADYDTFVDCPTIVGLFDRVKFMVNETPFSCVFWNPQGKNKWDIKKFARTVVKPIVTEEGRVFGSYPFPRYVFLFTVSRFGGGGLEHLNSTSIGLSELAMAKNVRNGGAITAHEFFHTWNVKRIRPIALGPFNYRQENYTKNLWVSEGWTSYYGSLSMTRLGMRSQEQYLSGINNGIRRELSKPRRKEHAVTWASRDIWHAGRVREKGSRVDYYTYGELLGLVIDLKIRDVTDNKKSLDDVMRFLNRWFAERNVGFEEDDIERACTAISNYDFSDFFARYVDGTVDLPFAEYFVFAGLKFESTLLQADLPFPVRPHSKGLIVGSPRGSGLERGDIIMAINGKKMTDTTKFLSDKVGGEKVKLTVRGKMGKREVTLSLRSRKRLVTSLKPMKTTNRKQKAILKSWLSAHED